MIITQHFGENLSCIDIATGTKTITCDGLNPPKGYKSIYSNMKGHNGTDFRAKRYEPIYAMQDGVVEEYVAEPERGLGIGYITDREFFTEETGKKTRQKLRSWHHLVNFVQKGDKVSIGQVIALADNTGYSSGDHAHEEMKPVTVKFNKDKTIKSVTNILQNNGFFGAVDMMKYMLDEKASDYTKWKSWQERLVFALFKYLK